jgi:hypothetical protein
LSTSSLGCVLLSELSEDGLQGVHLGRLLLVVLFGLLTFDHRPPNNPNSRPLGLATYGVLVVCMLHWPMAWISLLLILFQGLSLSLTRLTDLTPAINNCRGSKLKFRDSWTISLDSHCQDTGSERLVYEVRSKTSGSRERPYLGTYESYGRAGGTNRYERVLADGTTFKLLRQLRGDLCHWILQQGEKIYFASKCSRSETVPPKSGWKSQSVSEGGEPIEVEAVLIKREPFLARRLKLKNYASRSLPSAGEYSVTGEKIADPSAEPLSRMLHPAVGRALGETLHQRYTSAEDRPIDSITIDGLFNDTLLAAALDFHKVPPSPSPTHSQQVPLSRWVGPEEAAYCCSGKYRLSFDNWATK